jgi:hypothetical protein
MKNNKNYWEYEAQEQANQLYYDFDRSLSLALKCVGKLEKQEAKHLNMIGHIDINKYVSPFYELVRQNLQLVRQNLHELENERKKRNQDNINYENNPYTNRVVDHLNSSTNIDPIEPTTANTGTGMNTQSITLIKTCFDSFKDKLVMSTKKRDSVEPPKVTTHDDMHHLFIVSEYTKNNKIEVIWEMKKENMTLFDAVRFEVRFDSEKEIISIGNHARKNAYEFKFYYGDDWKSNSIVNYMLPQKFFTFLSELGYKGIWIDFPLRWVDMIKNETTEAPKWTVMVGE